MKSPINYGQIGDAPRSNRTVLSEKWSPKIRTDVRLVHATEGYEPAGAMARWTDEFWAIHYMVDGAINGRRYRTLPEAEQHFDRLTRIVVK